jgi:hypothetical protein
LVVLVVAVVVVVEAFCKNISERLSVELLEGWNGSAGVTNPEVVCEVRDDVPTRPADESSRILAEGCATGRQQVHLPPVLQLHGFNKFVTGTVRKKNKHKGKRTP